MQLQLFSNTYIRVLADWKHILATLQIFLVGYDFAAEGR